MTLKPGTNREKVWLAINTPMTKGEIKSRMDGAVPSPLTVVSHLLGAGWLRRVGKDKFVANKKQKKQEIESEPKRGRKDLIRPILLDYFAQNIGIEYTRQEIATATEIKTTNSNFYTTIRSMIKEGILSKRGVRGKQLYTALPSIKSNNSLHITQEEDKPEEVDIKMTTRKNIRLILLEHLQANIGVELTREQILNATGIGKGTASFYHYMNMMIEKGYVSLQKDRQKRIYVPQPSINNYNPKPHGNSKKETKLPQAPTPQEFRGQIVPPIDIGNADFGTMDLGAMVNQIVSINQQNQLYRQAFEGIMHIFEQLKLIEKDD